MDVGMAAFLGYRELSPSVFSRPQPADHQRRLAGTLRIMEDLDYLLEVIKPWISKYLSHGAESLSQVEAVGVGVWLLDAEVNNGGFDQYYFNTRGVLALKTVQALRAIGAGEAASLLEAANKDVPILPLPDDREERIVKLEEIAESSRFASLETEYYSGREDRIALLAEYLRKSIDR
ncbi:MULTISPECIES: DUF4375 domain-containing protein [unclassified Rhizobacter]|uniref:DMP19 family protein n=1 Tax=unclassified Rhizobacter TaxID=2640088 RepID=UPI0006F25D96|nr:MULTISPECIES: DUF4375 domain-containing protein [unclassified Rhizobacter]KQW04488.1 hypothetical protein ASC98_05235 [Rhizobacter sp. Root1238]KRB06330.1 hypothetical protein ASE08_11790 [Rhizobacter sp. Root16D2]